jgi:hypothetical protein
MYEPPAEAKPRLLSTLASYEQQASALSAQLAVINLGTAPPRRPRLLRGQYDDNSVVVYQAYNAAIASYASQHGHFGGPDFSFSRMSWIKPQFLWMMHRSSWATARDQERVLAIRLRRDYFEDILQSAKLSSYTPDVHGPDKATWLETPCRDSPVVCQWDPMHTPFTGAPLPYRVIQLGLRGSALQGLAGPGIVDIEDVTPYAHAISAAQAGGESRVRGLFDFAAPVEGAFPVTRDTADRLGLCCSPTLQPRQ